jgi:hypothetical protein
MPNQYTPLTLPQHVELAKDLSTMQNIMHKWLPVFCNAVPKNDVKVRAMHGIQDRLGTVRMKFEDDLCKHYKSEMKANRGYPYFDEEARLRLADAVAELAAREC